MSNEITARIVTRGMLTDAALPLAEPLPVTLPDGRTLSAESVLAQWDWRVDAESLMKSDAPVLSPYLLPLVRCRGRLVGNDGTPYRRTVTRFVDLTAATERKEARQRLESLRNVVESHGPGNKRIRLQTDPGVLVRAASGDDRFLSAEFKALDFLTRRAVDRLRKDGLKTDAARQAVLDALQSSAALAETLYSDAARMVRVPEASSTE